MTILDSFSKQVQGEDYKSGYLYNAIPDGMEIVEASVLDESVLLDLLQKNEMVYPMSSKTGTLEEDKEVIVLQTISGKSLLLFVLLDETVQFCH